MKYLLSDRIRSGSKIRGARNRVNDEQNANLTSTPLSPDAFTLRLTDSFVNEWTRVANPMIAVTNEFAVRLCQYHYLMLQKE